METLLLSYNDVDRVIDLDEIYKAVEQGFADMCLGKVTQPPILNLLKPDGSHISDIKCAADEESGFYALKTSGSKNMVYIYEIGTDELVCAMYGDHVRNLRTAAGAAVANNYLARKDAKVYFAYGGGRIGKATFRATMRVRPELTDCYVFGWMEGENDAFIKEMQPDYPNVRFHSCQTPEEGARAADIIVSVTLARKGPVIMREFLKPGTHVTAIGADSPSKQELDPKCFLGTKVVNDGIAFASENGDKTNTL